MQITTDEANELRISIKTDSQVLKEGGENMEVLSDARSKNKRWLETTVRIMYFHPAVVQEIYERSDR